MIEIRHLRTLAAVAASGKLSAAATRLHITQSAVSHQLRDLERHYGVTLFDRSARPLRLSAAGQRLLELAQETLALVHAAERDLLKMSDVGGGALRIAIECHTCFDWLMPVMDAFRTRWPDVELDLISGFHSDTLALLDHDQADIVVVSDRRVRRGITWRPLFRFEVLALMAPGHSLARKRWLTPRDFAGETLITYPVPEARIDVISRFLEPAGIKVRRRTAELTVAVLQLVASRRGLAALPSWGVKNYVDFDYVTARPIGKRGLWSGLYAAATDEIAERAYVRDFLQIARDTCFATLTGIVPLH
ncbi:MAG TPA: LysR family transcriptional regulator [Burkholderiales bacterium]|nr:LysR family transcriptional regulator [Burkholderiales bacterium]